MNVKKSVIGGLLLCLALVARGQEQTFQPPAAAQTATFPAVADTYLRQGAPNRSHGTEPLLRVGTADRTRALVRFDQAALGKALSGATLLSARLELYVQDIDDNRRDGRRVAAHRLSEPWIESGATWLCAVDARPSNPRPDCSQHWKGGSFTSVPTDSVLHTHGTRGWVTFDVTSDVAAFLAATPNHGWLLKIAEERHHGRVEYSAREAGSARAPRLVVTFERPDTTPPTVAITSPADGSFVGSATPTIAASYSDTESGVDPASVRLVLDGADRTAEAQVSASGLTFTPLSALAEAVHVAEVFVRDQAGNEGRASVRFTTDSLPPSLAIAAPSGTVTGDPTPSISVSYLDDTSGLDLSTLQILLDGADLTPSCTVGSSSAVCEPSPLTEGSHTITATIRDHAGHSATDASGFLLVLDLEPPAIVLTAPAEGSFLNTPAVRVAGTVSDDGQVTSVTVNGVEATLDHGDFQTTVTLSEGVNGILVVSTDATGKQSFATRSVTLDLTPPRLSAETPPLGAFTNQTEVRVAGKVTDESGVASLTVQQDTAAVTEDLFETLVPVAPGTNLISLRAVDLAGNETTAEVQVTRFVLPVVTITSPQDLSFLAATTTDVSGSVNDPGAVVTVNGVPAEVSGTTFLARGVPLIEGGNILTATAQDAAGHMGSDSINVVRDLTAPRLAIHYPKDGATLFEPSVTVSGMVNDIVAGTVNASEATVTVNGRLASVANRSFLVEDVPLAPGDNVLTAVATDESGNVGEVQITVHRETMPVPRVAIVSGNHQEAVIGTVLPEPLTVTLLDALGQPVAGKPVLFKVRGNNGSLDGAKRRIAVVTDAAGRASAHFALGTRAGVGNQVVEVTSPGFRGPAVFTATARPGAPASIVVDAGDQQVGIAGQELPRPLVAVVIDAGHNRLAGAAVKLRVVKGNGHFTDGLRELLAFSDSDGRVIAPFALDPEEGIANNVVEATIESLDPSPVATFVASGRAAGDPAATSISGVVLDNSNLPIAGVTLRVLETTLTARTDEKGFFRIAGAPVGTVKLIVDGSTAERPGSWPDLEFVLTTIPGRENTINMPIYLLPLDLGSGMPVDETRGGTLTLPEIPGFSLEIPPGSVTFPGGSRSGLVSVTVVHSDKIPMVPNFGQQPRFIVTIQPAGARFEPPARLTLPNLEGLAPGEVTEMYSFDHDLGHFVSIGPATVSEDGTVIVSNPGVGIIKAGWHCGGNPATAGTPHACPGCMVCDGNQCVPGCSISDGLSTTRFAATCSCSDNNDCTVEDRCQGGQCVGSKRRILSLTAKANGSKLTTAIYPNEPVQFTVEVEQEHCPKEAISFQWDFGDGQTSSVPEPTHTYDRPGLYRYKVKGECGNKCSQASDEGAVLVRCPEVKIVSTDPDIRTLCPSCEMTIRSTVQPAGWPIEWHIPPEMNLDGAVDLQAAGEEAHLTVREPVFRRSVAVQASPSGVGDLCRGDEVSVFIFVPPPSSPKDPITGLSTDEMFVLGNLAADMKFSCLDTLRQIRALGNVATFSVFENDSTCNRDGGAANAFIHAYINCVTASACGTSIAKDFWDGHENNQGNICEQAFVDFHNNEIGRNLAIPAFPGGCRQFVEEALRQGRLRWKQDPAEDDCPSIEKSLPTESPCLR